MFLCIPSRNPFDEGLHSACAAWKMEPAASKADERARRAAGECSESAGGAAVYGGRNWQSLRCRSSPRSRELVTDCAAAGAPLPAAVEIERVRRFCKPLFERKYRSADSRLADIEQLEGLAAQSPSRSAFLSDITLDPPSSTADLAGPPLLDEDYVILSTIHSAKGGEWDVVRIIHAADGMIPSDMATGDAATIEEERRLLYVAMTRARDRMEIYFPLRYYRRPRGRDDAHGYAQPTRFIPEDIRRHFDSIAPASRAASEDADGRGVRSGHVAVDAELQKLW